MLNECWWGCSFSHAHGWQAGWWRSTQGGWQAGGGAHRVDGRLVEEEHTGWMAGWYGVGEPGARRTLRLRTEGNMEHNFCIWKILNSVCWSVMQTGYLPLWLKQQSGDEWVKNQGLSTGWWPEIDGRCAGPTGVELGKASPTRGRQSRASAGYGHGRNN